MLADESGFPRDLVFTRVCHVKQGYEDRRRHIVKEFERRGVPVYFYTDWDQPEVTPDIRAELIAPDFVHPARVSLALKHVGIWRDFLETDLPYCLVFEDDVFLARDFVAKFRQGLTELGDPMRKAVIYLGNGSNYYTPIWKLRRGQKLYPALHARCADSYLITRPVAEARCAWIARNKISRPIDHQIEQMDDELGIEMLWFERPIAEQGSENGAFQTSVAGKSRPLLYKKLQWNWKKYNRMIFGHNARS
ncbi:glycosyltransferase family 25 protein [Mesorhizobium qingshengii]|uniref:Glycosyltransferase family 25 protein n=1 Tax=Mesorhizobium qingshengii TaxID=1165689 RepID=A0ABT4QRH4_9HYPH|nr:glycosyltransferase family 25 protein [Mesorhizobium qingshengii]MCZ8544163.1 glycosyltransferase family 25 protein [Mesorhizobium qingshengii]